MAQLHPLKNIQPKVWAFIRPMLLLSLLLHGVVLFVPLSSEQEAKPDQTPPEEEKISLTQLPPVNQPVAQPSAAPRPAPRPSVTVPRRAIVPARRNAPPATQPRPTQVQPSAPAAPTRPPANDFLTNFPRYPGTLPGSWGLPPAFDRASRKTPDGVPAVSAFYEQELVDKGYTPTQIEQGSRTVYEVSKQGVTQYLHLLPNANGAGTTIILNASILPPDLSSIQVEDSGISTFFSELTESVPSVDPNSDRWQRISEPQQLSQPTAFFSDLGSIDNGAVIEAALRPEIRTAVVGVGQTPDQVFQGISQKLEIAAYTVGSPTSYGGGDLYEISREETNDQGQPVMVTGYLSIVPSANGQDTIIFVWEKQPPN